MWLMNKLHRWLVRPNTREAALAHTVAGLMDALCHHDRGNDDTTREKLEWAKKDFMKYLDAAYPQPKR